jgi:hypothetical protein
MENDHSRMANVYKVFCKDCSDPGKEREIKEPNRLFYTPEEAQQVINAHFSITGHLRTRYVESEHFVSNQ